MRDGKGCERRQNVYNVCKVHNVHNVHNVRLKHYEEMYLLEKTFDVLSCKTSNVQRYAKRISKVRAL